MYFTNFEVPMFKFVPTVAMLRVVALALPLNAAALPVLTVSDIQYTFSNTVPVGSPSTSSVSTNTYNGNYSLNDVLTKERIIKTPATTTAAGLALLYDVTTTTKTYHLEDYDSFGSSGQVAQSTPGLAQYALVTGRVSSTQNIGLNFSIYGSGTYIPTNTPLGTSIPAVVSFYFGTAPSLQGVSLVKDVYSSYGNGESFSSRGYSTQSLVAGLESYFTAVIYAPSTAILDHFSIYASTDSYNFRDVVSPDVKVIKTLTGAETISPVPEPGTYALFLAGLGLMGGVVKRRNRQQA
jgi:hypothetical protein